MISNKVNAVLVVLTIMVFFVSTALADTPHGAVNSTDEVNSSALNSAGADDIHNSSSVSATMSWLDKTTVSGKIKNFLKDFKYQSGFNFMG